MDAGRRDQLTMRKIRFDSNFPSGQSSNARHEPLEKACEPSRAIDVIEHGEESHAEATRSYSLRGFLTPSASGVSVNRTTAESERRIGLP